MKIKNRHRLHANYNRNKQANHNTDMLAGKIGLIETQG